MWGLDGLGQVRIRVEKGKGREREGPEGGGNGQGRKIITSNLLHQYNVL